MPGQAFEGVGEPGARIDVVEPAGLDEGVDGRCLSATGVGSGEGPVATADGDAAQGALGGVVGQADPAIVEEAGERRPRSEEHTSELQSLMRTSYAVFCLK